MEITKYLVFEHYQLFALLKLKLPKDIKQKIFYDHLLPLFYEKKYAILMNIIKNRDASMFNSQFKLMEEIKTFIENKNFISFLREKNELFSDIYKEHYILNNKAYVNMSTIESLSVSWLVNLYH
uniref:Uncharacterized protein n=1 Tax=viral metagenome TaxID=1070528 RepID=A0A6C0KWC9_9ZZZZ